MNLINPELIYSIATAGILLIYAPVECISQLLEVSPPLAEPNVIFLIENKRKIESETKSGGNFKCAGRSPGYYADVDLQCKVNNNNVYYFSHYS